jgi:hypothetical protein
MAEKLTKADKLQRNVERLARRDDACRERFEIADQSSKPVEADILGTKQQATAA